MNTLIRFWETGTVPSHRRVRLLRRCHLDTMIEQARGRLSVLDVAILDFRLGVSCGHAHTQKETAARFGQTLSKIRDVEAKLFGEKISSLSDHRLKAIFSKSFQGPDWARKILDECYEN